MAEDSQRIRRICPHCGQILLFGPGSSGKVFGCPKCGTAVYRNASNSENAIRRICPQCGQLLLFKPGSSGTICRCPTCEAAVYPDAPPAEHLRRGPATFRQRIIYAGMLAVLFTALEAVVVAVVCAFLLKILVPGWGSQAPAQGSARALELPILLVCLLAMLFPYWVPIAALVGCVTQALSGRAKLYVLRILLICGVLDVLFAIMASQASF
jgi:DNA-directed RNA polymerase subunit M/transcription elongation factor TFIIS